MWAILPQCKTLNFGTQVYHEVLAPSQMGEGNSLYKTNNIWHQHADNLLQEEVIWFIVMSTFSATSNFINKKN